MRNIQTVNAHDHSHSVNRFAVIPTADRLSADPRFMGRGVTIGFLDSGFHRHPDLVEPSNRIVACHGQTKFIGDGSRWLEDPSNGMKVPDNYGGLNSVLAID